MKFRQMNRIILVTGMIIMMFACQQGTPENEKTEGEDQGSGIVLTADQAKRAGIEIGRATMMEISQKVQSRGVLSLPPEAEASVGTLVKGVVGKIYVQLGDEVMKGDRLCRLRHPDIIKVQQDYLESVHMAQLNKQKYEREQELKQENVTSDKSFQQAEANYQLASANEEGLAAHLRLLGIDPEVTASGEIRDYIDVKSPLSGRVSELYIHVGAFVNPDATLMEIVDRSKMYVELKIFEKDIPMVREGQKVLFTLSNVNDQTFEAKIFAIGGKLEEGSRVVRALAYFNNTNVNLFPGMFCAAEILGTGKEVMALPESAFVRESETEEYVFVRDNYDNETGLSRYRMIQVETGLHTPGYVEVKGPEEVLEGDEIVVHGAYYVKSQMLKELE